MTSNTLTIRFTPTGKVRKLSIDTPISFEELECHLFNLFDLHNTDRLLIYCMNNTQGKTRIASTDDFTQFLSAESEGPQRFFDFTTEGVEASLAGEREKAPFATFYPKDPERGIILKEQLGSAKDDFLGLFRRKKRSPKPDVVETLPIATDDAHQINSTEDDASINSTQPEAPFSLPTPVESHESSIPVQTSSHTEAQESPRPTEATSNSQPVFAPTVPPTQTQPSADQQVPPIDPQLFMQFMTMMNQYAQATQNKPNSGP
ncbi:hypothetical protein BLNAU_12392 [Blattamonas nauphoetae]|uniref:PB1 domain-containing protein n=1 Tax=Blattamonas nauphoetae TaxID=2049346 RepID=A0ABQ9XN28_9EUKA|nr:hypothetical protein BLNAU_12392 [Blattamonas nauphoetae]